MTTEEYNKIAEHLITILTDAVLVPVDEMAEWLSTEAALIVSISALSRAFIKQVEATKTAINLNPDETLLETCAKILADEISKVSTKYN